MKRIIIFLLVISISCSLIGCNITQPESNSWAISGDHFNNLLLIRASGKREFRPDTVYYVGLRSLYTEYEGYDNVNQIFEYSIPGEGFVFDSYDFDDLADREYAALLYIHKEYQDKYDGIYIKTDPYSKLINHVSFVNYYPEGYLVKKESCDISEAADSALEFISKHYGEHIDIRSFEGFSQNTSETDTKSCYTFVWSRYVHNVICEEITIETDFCGNVLEFDWMYNNFNENLVPDYPVERYHEECKTLLLSAFREKGVSVDISNIEFEPLRAGYADEYDEYFVNIEANCDVVYPDGSTENNVYTFAVPFSSKNTPFGILLH